MFTCKLEAQFSCSACMYGTVGNALSKVSRQGCLQLLHGTSSLLPQAIRLTIGDQASCPTPSSESLNICVLVIEPSQ